MTVLQSERRKMRGVRVEVEVNCGRILVVVEGCIT